MYIRSPLLIRHSLAVLLVAVGVLLLNVAVNEMLGAYADSMVTGTTAFPAWLPRARTVGGTIVAYELVVSVATYVVAPALIFGIGSRYGRLRAAGDADT